VAQLRIKPKLSKAYSQDKGPDIISIPNQNKWLKYELVRTIHV